MLTADVIVKQNNKKLLNMLENNCPKLHESTLLKNPHVVSVEERVVGEVVVIM